MTKDLEQGIPKATAVVIDWEQSLNFQQYLATDALGRTITFYVSQHISDDKRQPMVVYIQGSGARSVFNKDENNHWCGANYDDYLNPLKGRGRLILVEKPGVTLFDRGEGDASNWPQEFLREHTLERWTEAINCAIKSAHKLPGISKEKLLVLGHSEGAQAATHVTYTNASVTHLARMAGNGPTQLFDLILAMQRDCAIHSKEIPTASADFRTSTRATESVMNYWNEIVADRDSITKFMSGHPYRRWYSFCSNSPMEDLLHCSAKLYMVHGTEDTSVPIASYDVLLAELAAHNRPFISERIEGVDHSLNVVQDDKFVDTRLPEVVQRIIDWFFGD